LIDSEIFVGLGQYREEIFLLFGIFCLISWLIFNLYALREYFCPIYYIYARRSRHEKIDECYRK
uniref:G_PROTEIN_RECEP_F1_2 domain-containing protein n=1 Tax=Heligmosomoides polygyrus TaxID=6339 RepID=A0A183G0V7_HELPZ